MLAERVFSEAVKPIMLRKQSLRQGARCPVDIGFAQTEVKRRVRTCAKMYCVASDRARRENVPRHILFYILTIYFTLRKFYENNDCQFRQMGLQYP